MTNRHLYLAGFRGTGKSSVAALLGSLLAREVIDLDVAIQAAAQSSIAEIFAHSGEEAFRQLETQCLRAVAERPAAVVALGGGAVLRSENRDLIRGTGTCVVLTASPETIARRLAADPVTATQRPALSDKPQLEEIRELLQARQSAYDAVAAWRIATDDDSLEVVAQRIADWYQTGSP